MRFTILFVLLALFVNHANSQALKFNQTERCVSDGVGLDSMFRMTDANGHMTICVHWNDLISATDPDICDKVDSCLSAGNGSMLCDLMKLLPNGNLAANDRFFAKSSGGSCKTVHIDSILSQSKLCSSLSFPIASYSGSDYALVKKGDGSCARVLLSGIKGSWNCDSTVACLSSGAFCNLLRASLSSGTPTVNDSIVFLQGGSCKKAKFSSIPGIWNCDSTKACIGGSWFCDSVKACLDEGILCESMNEFPVFDFEAGDTVYVRRNGECIAAKLPDFGMSSFNCDSVKACLSQSWFCDSVQACIDTNLFCEILGSFPTAPNVAGYSIIGRDGDGNCAQIPIDSLLGECNFELEIGNFAPGSPEGPCWATTCDGGETHTNNFWNELSIAAGNTIEIYGNAQGGSPQKFDQVSLPLSATIGGTDCNPTLSITVGNMTSVVNLPVYRLVRNGSNIFISSNGTQCNPGVCASCFELQGGGSNTGEEKTNFQDAENKSGYVPNISDVRGWKNIPRFRSHRAARKVLQSGDLYFVGRKNSLQVAR